MSSGPKQENFLNKKQELFCRFVSRGETLTAAYELAGYAPSTSNAHTLSTRVEIKKRISELKEEWQIEQAKHAVLLDQARRADERSGGSENLNTQIEWTVNRVMDMMAENAKLAQIAGQFNAANDSLKMLGDAMSMFDKAKQAAAPAANPIAFIGKVVSEMANDQNALPRPVNPLAPAEDDAD